MTSLRLQSKVVRVFFALTLGCLGLAAGASFAASSSDTFVVGSSAKDSDQALSKLEYRADGHKSLKCTSGTYANNVWFEVGAWGTYPALEQVYLDCVSPGGTLNSQHFGSVVAVCCLLPPLPPTKCSGSHGAVTAIEVDSDQYVKDVKRRCADIFSQSGAAPLVDDIGWDATWEVNEHVQSNDVKEKLNCGSGQVVTGLYIGYRQDSDETAFTSLELYCSTLSAGATSSSTSTAAKTSTSGVKTKTVTSTPVVITKVVPKTTTTTTPTTTQRVTTTPKPTSSTTTTSPKPTTAATTTTTPRITTTTPKPTSSTTTTTQLTTTVHK